jgi:hypothetical protein
LSRLKSRSLKPFNYPFNVPVPLFKLAVAIFLFGIALMELGVIAKNAGNDSKMKLHFSLHIRFLIVAHITMIFGMLNPAIF